MFHVKHERDGIYQGCDARFAEMINNGAVEEVRNILTLGLPETLPAMRIIGVPELRAYIKNECTLEDAITKGQQATRNYAKRQMTWLRTQMKEAKTIANGTDCLGAL